MLYKIFSTVRYSLATVNFLFLITGIIVLSVGISVQVAYNQYYSFLSERFLSLPAFLIATGVIILLISFFGFYGAAMENYYMNIVYAGLMGVILVFQLAACISGYVLYDNTVALLHKSLLGTMPLYGNNNNLEVTILWDEVQQDFECCGVSDARDWLNVLNNETLDVPVSCCPHVWGTVAVFTCNTTNAFEPGCGDVFGNWVSSHAQGIGITGVIMCIMQVVAVGGAVWIARRTKVEQL